MNKPRKHELARATILAALADGKTPKQAELIAGEAHYVRAQHRAIPGGYSFRIYYLRNGNAVELATEFACTTDGLPIPFRKPKRQKRVGWFDTFFYDFLEAMN